MIFICIYNDFNEGCRYMNKILCAVGLAVASLGSALATTYPLTIEIPTLESILAQNPDFVPSQLPLLLGPESKVTKREDLAAAVKNYGTRPGFIKRLRISPPFLTYRTGVTP